MNSLVKLKRYLKLATCAVLLSSATHAFGAGVDTLRSFVNEVKSARTEFTQVVFDANGRKLQESSGTFSFARPGKFRWLYAKPYEQLLVGDGQKVWIYDKDLNQVTVKALGNALGSSPAALLAGDNQIIERAYDIAELPKKDGLEWLEASPKDDESPFERIRMGFRKTNLESMQLIDRLGQMTTIRFTKIERNPKLAADSFKFSPPAGADVVGDQ